MNKIVQKYYLKKKKNQLKVKFLPYMKHESITKWMQASDLFVFPSKEDALGLVGIEALASGTPVIASRVGGKVEYIKEGINGEFFQFDDEKELSEKIKKYLKSDYYNKLQKNSFSSVSRFSMEKIAKKMINEYKKTEKK